MDADKNIKSKAGLGGAWATQGPSLGRNDTSAAFSMEGRILGEGGTPDSKTGSDTEQKALPRIYADGTRIQNKTTDAAGGSPTSVAKFTDTIRCFWDFAVTRTLVLFSEINN